MRRRLIGVLILGSLALNVLLTLAVWHSTQTINELERYMSRMTAALRPMVAHQHEADRETWSLRQELNECRLSEIKRVLHARTR